jgi:pimeloyl-ACP methyl ester carboxylesterase
MEEKKLSGLGFLCGGWPLDPKKPTLFFIHGAGGSSRFWPVQLEALKARANTVAIDLPGHGQSDGPARSSVEEIASEVMRGIELIAVPPVIPVGLSMGGAVTQQLLLSYPGRFPAAVLVSTGAKLGVLPLIFDTIKTNYPAFVTLMEKFSASPKTDRERIRPALEDTAQQDPQSTESDFRACDKFDVRRRLPEIKIPVLVISAEEDKLTPPPYAEFLAKNLPNSRRVHILDSGHLAPVEKPEAVNPAIIAFLDSLELGVRGKV